VRQSNDRFGNAFQHFEHHVSDEARTNNHICHTARNVHTFDVAQKMQASKLFEPRVCLDDFLGTFPSLGTVRQQSHFRMWVFGNARRIRSAHHGKADQIVCVDIERGTYIQNQGKRIFLFAASHLSRINRCERAPSDSFQSLPVLQTRQNRRTCVSG